MRRISRLPAMPKPLRPRQNRSRNEESSIGPAKVTLGGIRCRRSCSRGHRTQNCTPAAAKGKAAALWRRLYFSTNGRLVRHVDICWVDRTHQVQYGDRVLVGRSAVWRIIERVVGLIEQESLGAVGEAVARAILNLRRVEHLTERQSATESRC